MKAQTCYLLVFAALSAEACSSSNENQSTTPPAASAGASSGGDSTTAGRGAIDEANTPPAAAPPAAAATPPTEPPPTPAAPVEPPPGAGRVAMNSSARDSFQQGVASARAGQLEAARSQFEAALNADPRAYQAAYNAGVIAERQGQDPAAELLYQRCLAIQADYELAVIARARLLTRTRRLPEAVTFAAGVARANPTNSAVRAEYARLLVLSNRAQEAIDEARQILRADERNVAAKLAVAEAYRSQGRLDLSLYIVNDLINGSDPNHPNNGPGANNPSVQHLRGLLQLEVERNVPAAIVSFRRAVELDAEFAEARNNLGVQYLLAGNYQEAIEHLQVAAGLSPSWAKAHLNLGDALRATGQYDRAMAEFQRVQQLDPSMVEVHYNTARLYAEQSRTITGSAVADLQRKVQLLQQAQASFTRFRDALGSTYASHARREDVEGQLTRLPQQIERTQRALQRAQRNAERASAAPAEGTPPPTPAPTPAPGAPAPTATETTPVAAPPADAAPAPSPTPAPPAADPAAAPPAPAPTPPPAG
jgi:tetratricopeptide (TPR) repeat protein